MIKFECTNVGTIKLNDKELNDDQKHALCYEKGYKVKLLDGENVFEFVAENTRGKKSKLEIKISFDEKAYNEKKAQEEKQRQQEEAERKQKEEAEAKAKAEAEAKAQAEAAKQQEAQMNKYATDYCSKRKTNNRKFGKLSVSGNNANYEFSKGKRGKYLTSADCRSMIDALVAYMKSEEGSINTSMMTHIINVEYVMGMREFYFFAAVGNPDDINSSQYGTYKQDQVIYYKDSYGISAQYFYFDDGILTSYQDF